MNLPSQPPIPASSLLQGDLGSFRCDQTMEMTTPQKLPDGIYFFRDEAYPLRELAMSESPADLASFLVAQAQATGVELIRNEIVEAGYP